MDFRRTETAPSREPAINLPMPIVASILVLLAIQGVRSFVSEETDVELLLALSFIPAQWSVAFGFAAPDQIIGAAVAGAGSAEQGLALGTLARYVVRESDAHPWSWITYALLHGSWMHVGLNCVWLAAFGAPVVRRAGLARCAVLALATALAGALAQWLSAPLAVQPMIGASAVVSGIMAAAATFVFRAPSWPGRREPSGYDFLRNRSALLFLAAWFAVNILFGLLAGPLGVVEGQIAWEAHIGGLVAGLALFPLLDRIGRGGHPDIRRA